MIGEYRITFPTNGKDYHLRYWEKNGSSRADTLEAIDSISQLAPITLHYLMTAPSSKTRTFIPGPPKLHCTSLHIVSRTERNASFSVGDNGNRVGTIGSCKIIGLHYYDYETCRLLGCDAVALARTDVLE
jgi:hypothetical protein